VNTHAGGQLEGRPHFRNEVIRANPPLIFSIVFVVHGRVLPTITLMVRLVILGIFDEQN
jgi:hypothetical protein